MNRRENIFDMNAGPDYDTRGQEQDTDERPAPEPMNCYLCYRAEQGKPDMSASGKAGPLREVIDSYVTNPADPTEVYVLSCTHHII